MFMVGEMVLQWLAVFPHHKMVLGSVPGQDKNQLQKLSTKTVAKVNTGLLGT